MNVNNTGDSIFSIIGSGRPCSQTFAMNPVEKLVASIDPVLIAPYRFFEDPMLGWWVGTAVLALWSVILGELTLAVVYRINRSTVAENSKKTLYYHEQSLKAKEAGDEKAYKGINKLANEAYGKSFFLLLAMGMASLWPAFFAAAWLNMRFGDFLFIMPKWAGGLELNFIAPFVMLYVPTRIIFSKFKRFIPFLNPASAASDSLPDRDKLESRP